MTENDEIFVRFYNFRYCTWYRWMWVSFVILFFLLFEYVILLGEALSMVLLFILSISFLFMTFRVWRFRVRVDVHDKMLEIGMRKISLRNCSIRYDKRMCFKRAIVVNEKGDTVVLSSIIEDFDRLMDLINQAVKTE